MSIAVNIDWPACRERNGVYVFPELPREGESLHIGDDSGVVKRVVWFLDENGVVNGIRVVVR